MLSEQDIDEWNQQAGLAEAGEDEILFHSLVIVGDEVADDRGRVRDRLEDQRPARFETGPGFFVDQQDSAQQAVLAHQVFDSGNLFFLFTLLTGRWRAHRLVGTATAGQQCPAGSGGSPGQESSACQVWRHGLYPIVQVAPGGRSFNRDCIAAVWAFSKSGDAIY